MKSKLLLFTIAICGIANAQINPVTQDTLIAKLIKSKSEFKGGIGLFPMPNKTMIGYRSNIHKNWAFDSKLGYTFSRIPLLNLELNIQHRHVKNEIFNLYSGFGITFDGFTPGVILPLGFELKPFEKYKNIVFVVEASPKLTFSFSSAFNSSLNGNIGIIYFKPRKKK